MGKSHIPGKISRNKQKNKERDKKYSSRDAFNIQDARNYVKGLGGDTSESGGYAKEEKLKAGDK